MIKFDAKINSIRFENGLRSFAAMLLGTEELRELMEPIGKDMVSEAKSRATFTNRTGNLFRQIKFIPTKTGGVFTTRESLETKGASKKGSTLRGAYYARMLEKGADIKATGRKPRKNKGDEKYLIFKINGEWKKVPSVRTRPRPFMTPVFDEYWAGPNAKGYKALADALLKRANEHLGG
jgi:hypothetical protein